MNDFASDLQTLIDKHREFPSADLFEMAKTMVDAAQQLYNDRMAYGPFADDQKFSGL